MPKFVKRLPNGLDAVYAVPPPLAREVDSVLKAIRRLSGSKIVTITVADRNQSFDVNSGGRVGHLPGHEALLRGLLASGLADGAGVIVRQFLPDRGFIVGPNGPMEVPRKRLYGVFLGGGTVAALDAEATHDAQTTDCETGARLPDEPLVEYGVLALDTDSPATEPLRPKTTTH